MSSEGIDYQRFVEDALRDAVRRLLAEVAERGLPGDHYFYIGFQTGHPGVAMPRALRDLYPEEMTIILQHQFWNLDVHPDLFSVELSFSASRHRLSIPFAALTTFADPSVEFALRFLPRSPVQSAPPPSEPAGAAARPALASVRPAAVSPEAAGGSGAAPAAGAPAAARKPAAANTADRRDTAADQRPALVLSPVAAPVPPPASAPTAPAPQHPSQPPAGAPKDGAGGRSGDVIRFDPSRRK